MKINDVYILEDRGLLYINGNDAKEFLQNIITNNIENVTEDKSCFSALLSPQGKFLNDFFIVKRKDSYLIEINIEETNNLIDL